MLIRKPDSLPFQGLPSRLENLLSLYEKNLQLEIFFIERKEIENLLEILTTQGDILSVLTPLVSSLKLPLDQEEKFRKRLEAADALRESNKLALDQAMREVSAELEQMNGARQRIRQVRQLSKSMYQESGESPRIQNWA